GVEPVARVRVERALHEVAAEGERRLAERDLDPEGERDRDDERRERGRRRALEPGERARRPPGVEDGRPDDERGEEERPGRPAPAELVAPSVGARVTPVARGEEHDA